jgi:hypothetical protein
LIPCFSYAQDYKFWVGFTDKGDYTSLEPTSFLSQRALDRRAKQSIELHWTDYPVNAGYVATVRAEGFQILYRSKWMNGVVVKTTNPELVNALHAADFVKEVYDFISVAESVNERRRDKFSSMTLDTAVYAKSFNQLEMLKGDVLHKKDYRGEGVHIAVLDAGFYKADQLTVLEKVFNEGRILGTYDFVNKEEAVYEDHSHGMSVLSTMAANKEGVMIGTAPDASYYLLRTEDVYSENLIEEYNWLAGAEYADSVGADIINSSLGYTTYDDPIQSHSYADMDGRTTVITRAAVMAARKGIIVCNSAGNEGDDNWHYIGAPADADSIFSVGAVDLDEQATAFSSYGPSFDGRVKPTVAAKGGKATILNSADNASLGNGTSFSSPILAGMLASLWQAHPEKTNMEIMEAVIRSAHQYAQPDDRMGYGIPDFSYAHVMLQGVEDLEKPSVAVYPNPITSASFVYIYTALEEGMTYRLVDMQGRVLARTSSVHSHSLEKIALPQLSKGLYLIEVRLGEQLFTEKVMVLE